MNCAGQPGFNSPKWAINLGLEQVFEIGTKQVTFNIDGRYRGDRVVGFEYLAQQRTGEDFTVDASLKLASEDDRWSVTAWVQNLTNQSVLVSNFFNSTVAGHLTSYYSAPRTFGVRAKVSF